MLYPILKEHCKGQKINYQTIYQMLQLCQVCTKREKFVRQVTTIYQHLSRLSKTTSY